MNGFQKTVCACILFLSLTGGYAQVNLPIELTTADGLPGEISYPSFQYSYTSPNYTLTKEVSKLRFTVSETNSGDMGSGFVCFALAEFYLYDGNGNPIELTADQFSTNAQEPTEGPLQCICDGNVNTYFHSSWTQAASENHYVEVKLSQPVKSFSFGYLSRSQKITPTELTISDGPIVPVIDVNTDDSLSFRVQETEKGVSWQMAVELGNKTFFNAFQMDIFLPEGMVIYEDDNALALSPERASATHSIVGANRKEHFFRVMSYSTDNEWFTGTEGLLFTANLSADRLVASGDYEVEVKNIRFSNSKGDEVLFPNVITPVKVSNRTAVSPAASAKEVVSQTYYSLNGCRVLKPQKGIVIRQTVFTDGTVEIRKEWVRE